jgi:hypothetical protein
VVKGRATALAATVGVAGGALLPRLAHACAVCYGNAEGDVIGGTRLSVVFLLGLTYLLLGGGIGAFLLARRHHRNASAAPTHTHRRADAP